MKTRSKIGNRLGILLGVLTASLGLGFIFYSMQEEVTNAEMLARMDTSNEPVYFEPVQPEIITGVPSLIPTSTPLPTNTPTRTSTLVPTTTPLPTSTTSASSEVGVLPSETALPVTTQVILSSPTPSATSTPAEPPTPEPTPTMNPEPPIRLVIPSISLDAPIVPVEPQILYAEGTEYRQWTAPDGFAVGWHSSSALLYQNGNTVLNGHNNIYGEVFRTLVDLEEGDLIYVYSNTRERMFIVSNKMILPEQYESLQTRMENARWIQPSEDERLTLITCWPYQGNSHRLIIVAVPYP